jgi:hypothetical protein
METQISTGASRMRGRNSVSPGPAEQAYREARDGFIDQERGYDAAMVSMDPTASGGLPTRWCQSWRRRMSIARLSPPCIRPAL